MNKKILVGSIIAVVILILVSFTGVVGYQTTSSAIARASPLFSIRTSRAIDRESRDIACDYVGKGITLPFPERDEKAILTQKVVDSIRNMDDKTFEKFIASLINNARKDKRFNGISHDEIREALYQIRNSDKPIPILDTNTKNKPHTLCGAPTCNPSCATFGHGLYGLIWCILLPLVIIREIIRMIIGFIWGIFHLNTGLPMCIPPTTVVC